MLGASWIGLLRRIPASQHDCLVLVTTTRAEIFVQKVIRLDRDFLVCLGRLAGSTDQGKLHIIPYDQMTYLAFNKKMTEEEIYSVVGKPGVAVQLVETAPAVVAPVVEETAFEPIEFRMESTSDPTAATPQPVAEAPPATGGAKVAPPSKSILLARLRERLANDVAKQPGAD
jgi:hypothetical protein